MLYLVCGVVLVHYSYTFDHFMTYLAVKALHFWLDATATCVCKKSQRSAYPQLVLLAMQCTYYYMHSNLSQKKAKCRGQNAVKKAWKV